MKRLYRNYIVLHISRSTSKYNVAGGIIIAHINALTTCRYRHKALGLLKGCVYKSPTWNIREGRSWPAFCMFCAWPMRGASQPLRPTVTTYDPRWKGDSHSSKRFSRSPAWYVSAMKWSWTHTFWLWLRNLTFASPGHTWMHPIHPTVKRPARLKIWSLI